MHRAVNAGLALGIQYNSIDVFLCTLFFSALF